MNKWFSKVILEQAWLSNIFGTSMYRYSFKKEEGFGFIRAKIGFSSTPGSAMKHEGRN